MKCRHKNQSGHPAEQDIRMCHDCDMRSVDGGLTWITLADYQKNWCVHPPTRAEMQLAKAAREINCAGPVDHRIRVLKKELSELLEKKNERIQKLEATLRSLESIINDALEEK